MKDNLEMWKLLNAMDWEGIRQCIANGEWNPNKPLTFELQPGGVLLLSAAAEHGLVALTKQLIESGVDVNRRLPPEDSALMIACGMGHREVIALLIEAGADVNAKSKASDEGDSGETPLMIAAGKKDIVERLVHAGANVAAKTRRGRTVLSGVLDSDNVDQDYVRWLLDAGCPVDGRDLHYPILWRDLELLKLLLTKQSDVSKPFDWPTYHFSPKRGDTPLFVAIDKNPNEILGPGNGRLIKTDERLAIVDLLIGAGADVNAQRGIKQSGWTPLLHAVAQDEDQIVQRLISAGADPNRAVECSRYTMVGDVCKRLKGPLSAIGMARERPDNKRVRKLLLGHE